jgi:phosphoglycolate phosphatase
MLDEIMDVCVAKPERTLMIGDTSYDLQMAKNASVQAVAVTFGAQSHDTLSGYNSIAMFHQFNELSEWLLA